MRLRTLTGHLIIISSLSDVYWCTPNGTGTMELEIQWVDFITSYSFDNATCALVSDLLLICIFVQYNTKQQVKQIPPAKKTEWRRLAYWTISKVCMNSKPLFNEGKNANNLMIDI